MKKVIIIITACIVLIGGVLSYMYYLDTMDLPSETGDFIIAFVHTTNGKSYYLSFYDNNKLNISYAFFGSDCWPDFEKIEGGILNHENPKFVEQKTISRKTFRKIYGLIDGIMEENQWGGMGYMWEVEIYLNGIIHQNIYRDSDHLKKVYEALKETLEILRENEKITSLKIKDYD